MNDQPEPQEPDGPQRPRRIESRATGERFEVWRTDEGRTYLVERSVRNVRTDTNSDGLSGTYEVKETMTIHPLDPSPDATAD